MKTLSVEEIRAIVGAEAEGMTDEQVYGRYLEVRAHAQLLVGILKATRRPSIETERRATVDAA